MDKVVGICGKCGGKVVLSEVWMAVTPQIPTCKACGAQVVEKHLPVLEMTGGKELLNE